MEKVCFMFGHTSVPTDICNAIAMAVEKHYLQYGVRIFVVGNRGEFDQRAASAVKALKHRYTDVSLVLLLAYHPGERPVALTDGVDGSFYPPLEGTPRPFAIVKANQYMANHADSIICFAKYPGNSKKLYEYAKRSKRKHYLALDNLGDDFL